MERKESSPILSVNENSSKEQVVQKKTRQDTPVDPAAKRLRFGAHFVKPSRVAPRPKQQQEIVTQPGDEEEEEVLAILPRTPPELPAPPVLSPRQSTPRTPIAPPRPLESSPQAKPSVQIENRNNTEVVKNNQINKQVTPMDQEVIRCFPSVISKNIGSFNIELFDFPIIPIECKFHFRIFRQTANLENIKVHKEYLEKKLKQQEQELEEHMKQFSEDTHRIVVNYVKDSIEPIIDILKDSNKKRLDNLILEQMKEKALRKIRNKGNKDSLELIDKAQMRFERNLQLKFQLDKLHQRLNENMPPPALNIMDKLQFRSKELRFPPQVNNKVLGLTDEERRILNYGPKFVPENPKQALDRLEEEISVMKDKVAEAWRRETHTIGKNPILVEQFANRLEEELRNKINEGKAQDPIVEKALERFQKEQKKGKVIFRQTDKSKVFHVDRPETYIQKSIAYMKKTDAYEEIEQSPLYSMIEKTEELLRNLVNRKLLPGKYFEKLKPNPADAELPHLYYNPKDHKVGEPLRPIVSGMKSPTQKISAFLDQIIRPIFDKLTPHRLRNSIEFLKHLKKHGTTDQTLLYTFDITDLYTMIPQQESILAICEMLGENKINK
ncbi:unnamed protein product, partial [Rotaria sp. Silwood2]